MLEKLDICKAAVSALNGGIGVKKVLKQLSDYGIVVWDAIGEKEQSGYKCYMFLAFKGEEPSVGRICLYAEPTREELLKVLCCGSIEYYSKSRA